MNAFKDPLVADKINKLIAAGVLKMGWKINIPFIYCVFNYSNILKL
jgi:hypothetical protein